MQKIYTTTATATGEGRNGHVTSADGHLDIDLKVPAAMGGEGGAANPETLFAAGYAACFHGALKLVAGAEKVALGTTAVAADVTIGKQDENFQLAVDIVVTFPAGFDADTATKLVETAHQVCPYSRATRGNIDVTVKAVVA